ncbi:BRCA1-A complex subunit RAP80 isoform X2 [Trichomycterus rosablanca]
MPRRKLTTSVYEKRRKVRRTDNDEDAVVITDSENEEEEDNAFKVSSRESRSEERKRRAQIKDMTEEEMLDLAMRISKQEATSATQREELEDADIKKAIAESLHASHDQAPETNSSKVKPHQDPDTVPAHLRRKLSFTSKIGKHCRSADEDTNRAVSGVEHIREESPLPPMPDLSPPSSAVPSAASQESDCHTDLNQKEYNTDSPDDEPVESSSQLLSSPVFHRKRLNRDLPSTSKALRTLPCTSESSLSLTCPDQSQFTQQQSTSSPKSPVFARTDPKERSRLRDTASHCTASNSFTDNVCKPEDTCKGSSSHKSLCRVVRDSGKRLSLSGKALPLADDSAPEDLDVKQESDEPKHKKHDSTWETNLTNTSEREDSKSMNEFTSHMVLHLSDEDKDGDAENELIVSPSPVFPQQCVSRTGQPKLSPTQPCSPSTDFDITDTPSHTTQDSVKKKGTPKPSQQTDQPEASVAETVACGSRLASSVAGKGEGLVSYYWGVPFCPKGQSPDEYTQVILTQLEVYEKSLKEARRQLLRKAEWGLPVSPCPAERSFGRRLKRHRAPQLLEEEEEERNEGKKEKRKAVECDGMEGMRTSTEELENAQSETYVVVSSPEAHEENVQKSPSLFVQQESRNTVKHSRKSSPKDASDDTPIQQSDEHTYDVHNGSFDVENTVCPETQMTEDNTPELMVTSPTQPQSRTESKVMEVDEREERPAEAEEIMEQEEHMSESEPPQGQSEMECPICSCLFPLSKIEMHAAYCDGTVNVQDQEESNSQATVRRTRKIHLAMKEVSSSEK